MRPLLYSLFFFLVTPAWAASWSTYENSRFGYAVDVPPEFEAGAEAANMDGRVFRSEDGTQLLRVYGGNALGSGFESSVEAATGFAREAGWTLSYERVTPSWASYSGTRNGIVLYARAIALCGGSQYASFELEYPERDLASMHPVVERLVASLEPTGNGAAC